jgi:hypothetical protein
MFGKNKDYKKRVTMGKEEKKRRHILIAIVCNSSHECIQGFIVLDRINITLEGKGYLL